MTSFRPYFWPKNFARLWGERAYDRIDLKKKAGFFLDRAVIQNNVEAAKAVADLYVHNNGQPYDINTVQNEFLPDILIELIDAGRRDQGVVRSTSQAIWSVKRHEPGDF
jgi:hypothetical protein